MFLVDFNNHTGTRVTYTVNPAHNNLQRHATVLHHFASVLSLSSSHNANSMALQA